MDAVSYSHADKQKQRIEKIIANPDSTSGIVTVPKTIASGETVTVPAGRVAVLPNVQVDGTLNIEGEVFVPSGATFGDLETQLSTKQSKSELAYNVNTSSYISNTLASGAIIERGSNANGEYIKYADGTLICYYETPIGYTCSAPTGQCFSVPLSSALNFTLPATFASPPTLVLGCRKTGGASVPWNTQETAATVISTGKMWLHASTNTAAGTYRYLAIGRWK